MLNRIELMLGAMSLIATILNFFLILGSVTIMTFSMLSLATFYMYFGFAIFNGILFRQIFQRASYKNIDGVRIVGGILMGIALSCITIGILMKTQPWPGAYIMLTVGLVGLVVSQILALQYAKTQPDYYSRILKRVIIYGLLGLFFQFIPTLNWVKWKFRDYPAYVDAVEKVMADPDNDELLKKMDEERRKIKSSDGK